ncbi:MAG: HEPN domain-containing protein [bacterium]|nr:HEPN domain-containing protein [bacterium]
MSEAEELADVQNWLRYAREDLRTARSLIAQVDVVPRHVCWLSQQAVEKSLKAVLVFLQTDFPRSHDLDALRNLIPTGWLVADKHLDLASLSEWAVEARYPGDWSEATREDACAAIQQAEEVWESVCDDFCRKGILVDRGE